ncbi:hypothetical protein F8568_025175 [Actinomadura sp. LD22]|uniref:Dihydrodipicolinate synthase family protein n=1 Tax=Actinomadura physcomitrii TaxID=2650748 RepID=A0A6I4MHX4_9ACTN|nr:dihydrodipicolinate synthase family protein [Actinomadura physcomitrii]MWA03617.1 hypothetical protein [Actinomadura physcomitrii]
MTHLLATVTVPLVTSFAGDGAPDPGGVRTLMERLAAAGVTSVMLFGSNGEGTAVETGEIRQYVRELATTWKGLAGASATVTVTVTAASTRRTVARGREALAAGADALVISPPFYYRHDDAELLDHFAALDALGAPWVAYNIPRYTGNPISVDLAAEMAALPHCVGIKDSSGDLELLAAFARIGKTSPAFAVSQGAESALVAGLRAGAAGITPGFGNLAPGACVALFEAVRHADTDRAEEIQAGLDRLSAIHRVRPGIAATKAALAVLGLVETGPSAPFRPYSDAETRHVQEVLDTAADTLAL